MWPKKYCDYKEDQSLIKNSVEPGKGIYGCEMKELNGWGNSLHIPKKAKKGFLGSLFVYFFRDRKKSK